MFHFLFTEPTITVFEKDNLKINFEVERPIDGGYEILMTAYNFSNNQTLDNFVLQAAVPKVIIFLFTKRLLWLN